MGTLINCVTCNKQVSTNAKKCPHCGERDYHPMIEIKCSNCNGSGKVMKRHQGHSMVEGYHTFYLLEQCYKCLGFGYKRVRS